MRGVCSSIASEAERCGDSSRRVPGEAGRLNQPHISRRDAEICHLWLVLDRLMIPRVQTSITEMFLVRAFFYLPGANVFVPLARAKESPLDGLAIGRLRWLGGLGCDVLVYIACEWLLQWLC